VFIQVMDFRTSRRAELATLEERWRDATRGKRSVRRVIIGQDRTDVDRYVLLAFYDDYESMQSDSALTETAVIAERQNEHIIELPKFIDLDVVKDVDYADLD